MTSSLQKGDPKHCKLNKMKGREISSSWGNMIKNPPNQTRGGNRESTWKRIQNDSYDSKSLKQISNCIKYASLSVRLQRGAWKWAGADALFRETACCAGFGTTVNYVQQWTLPFSWANSAHLCTSASSSVKQSCFSVLQDLEMMHIKGPKHVDAK